MKTYTAQEAATALGIHISYAQRLCRAERLGYTLPRHGNGWVITQAEIDWHREFGTLPAGRPRTKRESQGDSDKSENP